MDIKNCPDCKGVLEKGYFPDFAYGQIGLQKFAPGDILPGSAMNPLGRGSQVSSMRNVTAYRCTKCNRIFSYASDKEFDYTKIRNKGLVLAMVMAILLSAAVFITVFSILAIPK